MAQAGVGVQNRGSTADYVLGTAEGWDAFQVAHKPAEIDTPAEIDPRDVYLLLVDSHGYDAVNIQHWIVLLALFDSDERTTKKPPRRIALYADPSEDALVVWSWKVLLASNVCYAFKLTKSGSQ